MPSAPPFRRAGGALLFPLGAVAAAAALVLSWPHYVQVQSDAARAAALPTPAPVVADYLERDRLVAFWEKATGEHHRGDMISPRVLAEQYLQRYRERGDLDDVLRAERAAEIALANQPRGNMAAELELASVELTLHRFRAAMALTRHVESYDRGDPDMGTREASVAIELGDYATAARRLNATPPTGRTDHWRVVDARYLELTGHLREARDLLAIATAYQNGVFDAPAQQRAWYYFRSGEMAFEAGDNDAAVAFERQALVVFPGFADANRLLAKFLCAQHRWEECLEAAQASAKVVPYPETLGYEVDALRALGRSSGAEQVDGLIVTEARIGNALHVSDRLLAIYYAEHREHTGDAYAIAKRELHLRDDIFAEDTFAWAAAADDRWDEARAAMRKAIRFDTENALLQYHAGAIAEHFGDAGLAQRRYERALAINPSFHPFYAEDARVRLRRLAREAAPAPTPA